MQVVGFRDLFGHQSANHGGRCGLGNAVDFHVAARRTGRHGEVQRRFAGFVLDVESGPIGGEKFNDFGSAGLCRRCWHARCYS